MRSVAGLLILLFFVPLMSARGAAAQFQEVLYAVAVNGSQADDAAVFISSSEGRLYATADELNKWRIQIPSTPVRYDGSDYYPLDSIPKVRVELNRREQALNLVIPPEAFQRTDTRTTGADLSLRPQSGRSAFLNYEIDARSQGRAFSSNADLDFGATLANGLLQSRYSLYTLGSGVMLQNADTHWSRDSIAHHATFSIGSGYSSGGTLGQSLRFAGLQWGTNDATRPDFDIHPVPVFYGIAQDPSAVEVYAGNVLVTRQDVPTGPFSIAPQVSGGGMENFNLIVHDASGHSYAVSEPFNMDSRLLSPGLTEYSYSAGFESIPSGLQQRYGPFFFEGSQRHGFSKNITADFFEEAGARHRGAGGNVEYGLPRFGTLTAGLGALSAGSRYLALTNLGYDYDRGRLSFSVHERTVPNLLESLGIGGTLSHQFQAGFSYESANSSSLDLSYIADSLANGGALKTIQASYSRQLAFGSAYLSAAENLGQSASYRIQLGLSTKLGRHSSVSTQIASSSAGGSTQMQYEQLSDHEYGMNYSVTENRSEDHYIDAQILDHGRLGDLNVELAPSKSGDSLIDVSARGGLVFIGGRVYRSNTVANGFALVNAGYPNIPVYSNNTLVGKTDRTGRLFVPMLAAYLPNTISIDPNSLPIGVAIETDKTVVPVAMTGTKVVFHTLSEGAVTLKLVDAGGKAIPPGSALTSARYNSKVWYVANDGDVYLDGVAAGTFLVHVNGSGFACDASITVPQDVSKVPDLGSIPCK